MSSDSVFSAQEAALGYLYQVRCALWLLLERGFDNPEIQVSLEKLDDISFEQNGKPEELLQTKHHTHRVASLSNTCPDIWKTLRVWSEALIKGEVEGENITLTLITTATAAKDSLAMLLRSAGETRNVDGALKQLRDVATNSKNEANKEAYESFLRLQPKQQMLLVSQIHIFDHAPNIIDVGNKIACYLRPSTSSAHLSAICQLVEGWWLKIVIDHLRSRSSCSIKYNDLHLALDHFRPMFQPESLPDDPNDRILVTMQEALNDQRTFVEQMRIINGSVGAVKRAIEDYYYASSRRSRWVRDGLLFTEELTHYESELRQEWERIFEAVEDELKKRNCMLNEDDVQMAGRDLLRKAEDRACQPAFFIRPNFQSPHLARGCFHLLSDALSIGWHIDFHLYLQHLRT